MPCFSQACWPQRQWFIQGDLSARAGHFDLGSNLGISSPRVTPSSWRSVSISFWRGSYNSNSIPEEAAAIGAALASDEAAVNIALWGASTITAGSILARLWVYITQSKSIPLVESIPKVSIQRVTRTTQRTRVSSTSTSTSSCSANTATPVSLHFTRSIHSMRLTSGSSHVIGARRPLRAPRIPRRLTW